MQECLHDNLELRGQRKPGGITLWFRDISLVCPECGTHFMSIPYDLTRIKNISHPAKEDCLHPNETRWDGFAGRDRWICLQCGETGVSCPTTKLEIMDTRVKTDRDIGIEVNKRLDNLEKEVERLKIKFTDLKDNYDQQHAVYR